MAYGKCREKHWIKGAGNCAGKKEIVPCRIVGGTSDPSVYAEAFLAGGREILDYL